MVKPTSLYTFQKQAYTYANFVYLKKIKCQYKTTQKYASMPPIENKVPENQSLDIDNIKLLPLIDT